MSRLIPLTKGQSAIVDDDDFARIGHLRWYAQEAGGSGGFYAARRTRTGDGRSVLIYMHQHINKTPVGMATDHINGDGLDNRKANLRTVTVLQNQMNKAPNRGGTSRLKGAWFDGSSKQGKRWRSSIRLNGKGIHLGRFHTEQEAAAAYAAAAAEHFGEFSRTHGGSI